MWRDAESVREFFVGAKDAVLRETSARPFDEVSSGPVALPWELVLAAGFGALVLVAAMTVTSFARVRAPATDPLVGGSLDPNSREEHGGAWPRASRALVQFDEGRELARHVAPARIEDAVEQFKALGLGDAHVHPESASVTHVRVPACRSCRTRRFWHRARRACYYEQGLLAGAFASFAGPNVHVTETACGGRRGACVFRVEHAPRPSPPTTGTGE